MSTFVEAGTHYQSNLTKPQGVRNTSYKAALAEACAIEMRRDPSVVLYGLDVTDHKRIFGTTEGLLEEFGASRVFHTPLSEDAMTGAGMGMALNNCGRVSLYGFGNASEAKARNGSEHALACGHYWDCSRHQGKYFAGKQGYHDWNAQWRVMNSWFEQAAANESLRGRLTFVDDAVGSATPKHLPREGVTDHGMPW